MNMNKLLGLNAIKSCHWLQVIVAHLKIWKPSIAIFDIWGSTRRWRPGHLSSELPKSIQARIIAMRAAAWNKKKKASSRSLNQFDVTWEKEGGECKDSLVSQICEPQRFRCKRPEANEAGDLRSWSKRCQTPQSPLPKSKSEDGFVLH
jgi:hypothetical protein